MKHLQYTGFDYLASKCLSQSTGKWPRGVLILVH